MRTRLVIGLALATLGISPLACSSSPNPYAQVSEYCAAYAKAICQVSSTCQFDPSTCESYQQSQCEAAAPSTTSATRMYQPDNVQPCINALNAAYGNNASSVSASTIQNYTQLCDKVFLGTVAEGDACTSSLDCANSADVCASAPGSSGSICVTPSPKAVNDPCADPGDECPPDSYCASQNGGSPKCTPSQSTSQPCSSTLPCDSTTQCTGGYCEPLSSQGQDCTASTNCGTGLFCDLYTDSQAPTPVCVNAYTFARGSVDCLGIEGQGTTPAEPDSGTGSSSGSSSGGTSSSGGDSGTGSSSGAGDSGSGDAPSGG